MIFSRSTQYAIQALVRVVEEDEKEYLSVEKLSTDLDIPNEFLAKIFQRLAKKGFLESRKGPGGGFKLARQPETIDLYEILEVFEGPKPLSECVYDGEECRLKDQPCPIHDEWSEIRSQIIDFTKRNNLSELAENNMESRS